LRLLALLPGLLLGPVAWSQQDSATTAEQVESAFDDAFGESSEVDPFDDFDAAFDEEPSRLVWSGFVEAAYGRRRHGSSDFDTSQTLGDLRARVDTEWSNDALKLALTGDALYDDYEDGFETDLRELSLSLSPGDSLDLKIGRQVLTWGTGDLLFLNDLFPKGWVSFFAGRDDEYLKAPSDAVRATWYNGLINVDAVWSPRFDPDDYLTGERFSFFWPMTGQVVAPRPPLAADEPNDGELALRLFRTVESTEYAIYAYRGFFKRPLGASPELEPTFPALAVVGGSLRRPLGSGLFNAEAAYHASRDDDSGSNPLVPNDQFRLLVGYEFEARARLTLGFQGYLERTLDYDALIDNSPSPAFEPERSRFVLTNRVTYRSARDRLTLSLFTFYSPTDDDYYLRPSVSYRQSDRWLMTAGANLFGGKRNYTFFGQLEDNTNAYIRIRFIY
jgi:hypothetical protein